MRIDPLVFFKQLSFMTDPEVYADLFSKLPNDIPALRKVVQGLLIHQYWAKAYGFSIPEDRVSEYQIRDVARICNHGISLASILRGEE